MLEPRTRRTVTIPAGFSLAQTCGPVYWTTGRSPRHAWRDGRLTWVGWEGETVAWRSVRQSGPDTLEVDGGSSPADDQQWVRSILGTDTTVPTYNDPTIAAIAGRFPGLRPYCDGSVFDGIITSIVGQSISVAAAAVTQARLAALFAPGIEIDGHTFRPLPRPDLLASVPAELVRQSGVTWKRAEALIVAARESVAGNLPGDQFAREYPDDAVRELMKLPLVGRWTAESVVLWGIGAPNAHPTGDVALLRAARAAYSRSDMTLQDLDVLAERWHPARGLAARLLWTNLFGPAPDPE